MNVVTLHVDPRELAQFTGSIAELPRKVGLRHLRISLMAWGGIVKTEALARVPTQTKLLKRSLGVDAIIPDASWNVQHHGHPSRVEVGARKNFVGLKSVRRLKSGKLKTRFRIARIAATSSRVRRASRYAHLAEKHQPYIAPAQQAGNTRGLAKFKQKLGQGIELEAQKIAARKAARRS